MKSNFPGFYPPTDDEYKRLWNEALIVLDTNVLLNLYRLPNAARNEFFGVLEKLKDRLWIPYQVALEFQRNRLSVIAKERKVTEDALASAKSVMDNLSSTVEDLQIEKRELGIDPKPLLSDLANANEKLIAAIAQTHSTQFQVSSDDSVRTRLDGLFEGLVGAGPKTQEELDGLVSDGDSRYQSRIPPGFEDASKEKGGNEDFFIHEHLKYPRKFGDLILWRQLLSHVKDNKLKSVLLITADKKEDWWWREQGKTIGAHPELVCEIKREAQVELFWMYSSVQFVEHANKYIAAEVSEQSVAELKEVAITSPVTNPDEENTRLTWARLLDVIGERGLKGASTQSNEGLYWEFFNSSIENRRVAAVAALMNWLKESGFDSVVPGEPHADLLVKVDEKVRAYEIVTVSDYSRLLDEGFLQRLLKKKMPLFNANMFEETVLVVVSNDSPNEHRQLEFPGIPSEVRSAVDFALRKVPLTAMMLGRLVDGVFVRDYWCTSREARSRR